MPKYQRDLNLKRCSCYVICLEEKWTTKSGTEFTFLGQKEHRYSYMETNYVNYCHNWKIHESLKSKQLKKASHYQF